MLPLILRAIGMGGSSASRARTVLKGLDTASKASKSRSVSEVLGAMKHRFPSAGLARAGTILGRAALITELDALISPLCGMMTIEERVLTMANLVEELDEMTGDGTTAVESLVMMSTVGVVYGSSALSGKMRLILDAAESADIRGNKTTTYSARGKFTGFGSAPTERELSSLVVDKNGKPVKFKSGMFSRGTKQLAKIGNSKVAQVVSLLMSAYILVSAVIDDEDNSGRIVEDKDISTETKEAGSSQEQSVEFVKTTDDADPGITKQEQLMIASVSAKREGSLPPQETDASLIARSILGKAVSSDTGDEPDAGDAEGMTSAQANAIISEAMTEVFLGPLSGAVKVGDSYGYCFGRSAETLVEFSLRMSREINERASGLIQSERGYADSFRSYVRDLAGREMLRYCTSAMSDRVSEQNPMFRTQISSAAVAYDELLAELDYPHENSSEAVLSISQKYDHLNVRLN